MNHDEAFVGEVRAHPRDDGPRLIFADYLEEAGDPRGELIRIQVELAGLPATSPRRSELESRESQILEEHAELWLAPLRALGAEGVSVRCFQKGLIERVRIRAIDWLANGETLCQLSPALYYVQLRDAGKYAGEVASSPAPPQVTALDLSSNGLADRQLLRLKESVWRDQLQELHLAFNGLGDEGVRELTSVSWKRLSHLDLAVNGIGPRGAHALAGWPTLGQLKSLSLNVNRIGNEGASALAETRHGDKLEQLDLSSNEIEFAGAEALAQSRSFESLRHLNLRANRINLRPLIEALHYRSLKTLDLRGNPVRTSGRPTRASEPPGDLLIQLPDRNPPLSRSDSPRGG